MIDNCRMDLLVSVSRAGYGDANERLFLMKYLAAFEEAAGLGAKIYEGENPF